MKKILLSLVLVAFAANTMIAQSAVTAPATQVKKECCEDHKDGQPCTKPADQQCDDCKAKAAAATAATPQHQCKKAEGQKHECKKDAAAQHQCKKAEGQKHECKKDAAAQHECKKAEGQKHECKKDAAAQHQCKKAEGQKHEQCKGHKDGQACDKPADQQCDDCKAKAAAKKN